MRRQRSEREGRHGEDAAARHLEADGWQILARRVRNKAGEIDIVARRAGMVAFVEVKWRAAVADLDLAIDSRRLGRVAAAAEAEMHRFMNAGDDCRIDVILLAPGQRPRHLENVGQF
ncbi:YraN family protein [Croceicoccus sp. F390]|uniref:UPF0102 protein RM533_05070 n=1 Tax=Croceicoccus esteveae TaxID=3075597 RepID=A0ABU2ZGM7_9SPHN|nr:YraN family protein [Croceicoccus sp. F390]MDT0575550.1 YraN family protein [Croceicoccus sp. F390]